MRTEHHERLILASIWLLATDANHIRNNRVITTATRKCTKTEKLSTNHDFKITIYMEAWSRLTDEQREVALDEALCRCGVKYLPMTAEVNGKRSIVKDEVGRTVYTDDIAYAEDGTPKWCLQKHDASVWFEMVQRHGAYADELKNASRVLDGNEPIYDRDPNQMKMTFADTADIQEEADAIGV